MSEIITQGRRLADLGVALVESVEAAGGNDEDARRVFKDEQLRMQLGQLVMGNLKLVKPVGLPTTYDQALGLAELIKRAVGPENLGNINSDITQERFSLKGTGVRQVNLRVEPFPSNETGEQAAKRLTTAGHTLANTGDLAGFLRNHPKEVEKWRWVVALSEDSRWTRPGGRICVPCAGVRGADRHFVLAYFRRQFYSVFGVLVLCE